MESTSTVVSLIPPRVIDTLIPAGLFYVDERALAKLHEFAVNVQVEYAARLPGAPTPQPAPAAQHGTELRLMEYDRVNGWFPL